MNRKKFILYIIATLLFIGGFFGLIKGFFPNMEWISFRKLLGGGSTFESGTMPFYANIYGIGMAILEIFSAICIIKNTKSFVLILIIVFIINIIGCIIAIFLGDLLACISLIFRLIILYIIKKYVIEK